MSNLMRLHNFPVTHGVALVALALLPGVVAANNGETDTRKNSTPQIAWHGNVEAGYLYDSNVNIRELDTNTNRADQAWVVKAALGLTFNPVQPLTLKAGINHSDQRYQTYDDFDLAITTLYADASYDFDVLTLGMSQHQADANLATEDFMQYTQNTLYASRMWNQQWFTRIEWRDIEKSFAVITDRNAQATVYSGDLYWFTPSAHSFVTIGYAVHDETATNAEFSYTGDELRAKWQTRSALGAKGHVWQVSWQRTSRDYAGESMQQPELAAARSELRQLLRAEWQIPLWDSLRVVPHIEYVDNKSNVDAVDYHETVAGVNVSFRF